MISSGYFLVTKKLIDEMYKNQALQFIYEMFTYGGRIGYYEYLDWKKYIEESK